MLVERAQARGEQLSNTWPSYPLDRDTLGKLRLIPNTASILELEEAGNAPAPEDAAAAD